MRENGSADLRINAARGQNRLAFCRVVRQVGMDFPVEIVQEGGLGPLVLVFAELARVRRHAGLHRQRVPAQTVGLRVFAEKIPSLFTGHGNYDNRSSRARIEGRLSMQIISIDTYIAGNPWKNWLFAKVTTSDGLYGVGEGTMNCFAKTVEAAIHELKPLTLGMNPFQVEIISQRLIRDVYSEGAQVHMCAVAAIEIACWDIIGKACKQPIYNLWGGRCHERLRAYANGWYRGPRTPESFAEKAREVARRGYTALKFDPFGNAWRMLSRHDFDLSIDIIRAVREAVGDGVDLLIEGHSRFNVSTAVELANAMAPMRPAWFEEPVPHTNIAAMVEVARRSTVP